MKILFLCTAHNSLSQRLYLELTASGHEISIEYALSGAVMLEAVELFKPNIIICPVSMVMVNDSMQMETVANHHGIVPHRPSSGRDLQQLLHSHRAPWCAWRCWSECDRLGVDG